MKYFAGIDVGGTNTKIGLLDKEGNILKTVSIKTESEKGPENTIRRIWKEVIEIADALSINVESIAGIGVGIPGPVVNESVVKIILLKNERKTEKLFVRKYFFDIENEI